MPLAEGSRLGPYEIGASIGAGGMGEVYRARDTRLDRAVAIKVLPATVSSDPDARARLKREARALSLLSHPNICALYDVGEHGDTDYFVMELVDGETLAARIARGALPIAQAIEIAAQIADALDRAHRAGVVHRDLKPANVMLTRTGTKLLDFGLVRAVASVSQDVGDATTLARSSLTAVGTIVGTIQYMSPEQIEGHPADVRSDIFALGLVLFEMVTGRRAFEGGTAPAIAAAILSAEPPAVSSLKQTAPPALDGLVRLCLEKHPDARWQSAHDVSVLLRATDLSGKLDPPARARGAVRWLPWLFAGAAGSAALLLWSRPEPAAPAAAPLPVVFEVPPPGPGFMGSVEAPILALSPDGSRLAFIKSGGGVWIRSLASTEATPLAGAEHATAVFWSPNGREIGFFGNGTLHRIDAAGGAAVPLCPVSRWTGHTATWGHDEIVFSAVATAVIFRVPTKGGPAVELIKPDPSRGEFKLQWPHFLPDKRRLLYTAYREDRTARLMLWEPGKPVREIMPVSSNVEYVDPGYLLFVRDGTLLAQRFDPATGTIAGDPAAVAQPVSYQTIPGIGHFTASRNGMLAYQAHADLSRVAWFDRTGRQLGTALPTDRYVGIRLTPDSRQLMFSRGTKGAGTFDLWTLDVERGIPWRVTDDPGNEMPGLATPGQSTLVYSAGPFGPPKIQVRNVATGAERLFRAEGGMQWAEDLTPDGETLIFRERNPATGTVTLLAAPLEGGDATPLLDTRFTSLAARLSPDGKWLAYLSDENGPLNAELYVVRWPGGRDKIRVSTDGAGRMRWGPQGRELFYISRAGLMSAPMSAGGPGKPQLLADRTKTGSWSDFDAAADGRFVAIVSESVAAQQPLTVILNWQSRLK